jgi:hypothetical protein
MRSLIRDIGSVIDLQTVKEISGSGSSAGVFSDGTPFRSIRTAQGEYDILFDPRLAPVGANAAGIPAARNFYYHTVLAPGKVHIRVMFQDTTANDADFYLWVTAIDNRV